MADSDAIEWDFFLAHASADTPAAEALFEQLAPHCRVFLDTRRLRLGDEWDAVLLGAQRRSRVTVVLVSKAAGGSYYQREEVAAALALAGQEQGGHRVVPIYLDATAADAAVPYGLRLKHGVVARDNLELATAAARLLELLRSLPDVEQRGSDPKSSLIGPGVSARGRVPPEQRLGLSREALRWGIALGSSVHKAEMAASIGSMFGPVGRAIGLTSGKAEIMRALGSEAAELPDVDVTEEHGISLLVSAIIAHYAVTSVGKHASILLGLGALRATAAALWEERARAEEPAASGVLDESDESERPPSNAERAEQERESARRALEDIDPSFVTSASDLLQLFVQRKPASVVDVLRLLDEGCLG